MGDSVERKSGSLGVSDRGIVADVRMQQRFTDGFTEALDVVGDLCTDTDRRVSCGQG